MQEKEKIEKVKVTIEAKLKDQDGEFVLVLPRYPNRIHCEELDKYA